MDWDKFAKKEERGADAWHKPEEEIAKRVLNRGAESFLLCHGREELLPISGICNARTTRAGKEEHLLNNEKVALVLSADLEVKRFFRLPAVLPESLVYFSPGLFFGISKSREEAVSFRLGGRAADSEFSIGSYAVCMRLEDAEDAYATEEEVCVRHRHGVAVLRPVL